MKSGASLIDQRASSKKGFVRFNFEQETSAQRGKWDKTKNEVNMSF